MYQIVHVYISMTWEMRRNNGFVTPFVIVNWQASFSKFIAFVISNLQTKAIVNNWQGTVQFEQLLIKKNLFSYNLQWNWYKYTLFLFPFDSVNCMCFRRLRLIFQVELLQCFAVLVWEMTKKYIINRSKIRRLLLRVCTG